jgi:hypothetical protein
MLFIHVEMLNEYCAVGLLSQVHATFVHKGSNASRIMVDGRRSKRRKTEDRGEEGAGVGCGAYPGRQETAFFLRGGWQPDCQWPNNEILLDPWRCP